MIDTEARLRETLHAIAGTTEVTGRVEEATSLQQRGAPRALIAVASFVAVLGAVGLPLLLSQDTDQSLGAPAQAPAITVGPTGSTAAAPIESTPPLLALHDPPKAVTDPDWVLDPGWFVVDDDDLVFIGIDPDADIRPPEFEGRHFLRSENAWCLNEGTIPARGRFDRLAASDEITLADLEYTCAVDNDFAPKSPPATMTLCRAVYVDAHYEEWGRSAEFALVEGAPGLDPPGFPVVLGWESDCVSEQVDTNPAIVLFADFSLAEFNRVRQMEIALTSASYQNCFTFDQANEVAGEARRILGLDWLHAYMTIKGDSECYRPFIEPEMGALMVMPRY